MGLKFFDLKDLACDEAYEYFDKHVRKLPRNKDGTIKETLEFADSDIDAFRHAYVSGRYTQEYGEWVADVLGQLNEVVSYASPGTRHPREKNMDLWNNAVGRKYGKKSRSKDRLAELLIQAMKDKDLIIHPSDSRNYSGKISYQVDQAKPVIVLKESPSGRNELFFDTDKKVEMTRGQFVKAIQAGAYPGYRIVNRYGKATPTSLPDSKNKNNLG